MSKEYIGRLREEARLIEGGGGQGQGQVSIRAELRKAEGSKGAKDPGNWDRWRDSQTRREGSGKKAKNAACVKLEIA